ncbi:MAG: hypothetical protein F4Z15_09005 [Gammaproteobacteria bacterium]|nr:hypothetical protein [Gammaproteobacteria bacterium]MYD77110.1 hypothetical protein [Gammaproteobacteria bacterium]MYJ52972.1 hypothetical protein [Gammaproteobacteria bacterium]
MEQLLPCGLRRIPSRSDKRRMIDAALRGLPAHRLAQERYGASGSEKYPRCHDECRSSDLRDDDEYINTWCGMIAIIAIIPAIE